METTGSHCCICTGVCAHTGGVQYCEMHNPNRREINNFYAPYAICFHCAKKDQRIDELEGALIAIRDEFVKCVAVFAKQPQEIREDFKEYSDQIQVAVDEINGVLKVQQSEKE